MYLLIIVVIVLGVPFVIYCCKYLLKKYKIFFRSVKFWKIIYELGDGILWVYFYENDNWKVYHENEGNIKDWFGPYIFKGKNRKYYLYCKTDDVSIYLTEIIESLK